MPTHLLRRMTACTPWIKGALFLFLAAAGSAQIPPLTITTTSPLPAGDVGSSYQIVLSASGGTGEYSWTITAGALPQGLSLDSGCLFFASTCTINGIPTAAVTSNFTLQVTDNNEPPDVASAPFSLTINPVPTLPGGALPGATVNTYYSQPLTANGGTAPFYWTLEGDLPPGLSLDSGTCPFLESGLGQVRRRITTRASIGRGRMMPRATTPNQCLVVGQPTTVGTSTFTIGVEDSYSNFTTAQYSITVNSLPAITTTSLPAGMVGLSYSQTLAESGGTPPFLWSVSVGLLPAGLALNSSTGQITGAPTAAGTASFTVQLADANGATTAQAYSLVIVPALVITTGSPLPAATLGASYSQTVAATGGTPPYNWSISSGTLPVGLALNSGSGQISGTPTAAGTATFTVQVTDYNQFIAAKSFTLTVNAALVITSSSPLPATTVGASYSQTLTATGGTAPLTWSLSAGTLPAGLTLNSSTGQISGAPTAAGTASFTIQVADVNRAAATKPFTLIVNSALTITNASPLPQGTVGVSYADTLTVTGGTTPITWTVSAGALPAGLSLNSGTGQISGTPTKSGTASFSVEAADITGANTVKAFAVTINPTLTIITASPLPSGNVGVGYSRTLAAAGGIGPYTWALSGGALPAGLSLNSATGLISGTPAAAGTANFVVEVTDTETLHATASFSVTIIASLVITTTSPLPAGTVSAPYNRALTATGGVPPYTWSLTAGSLPAGLALNSSSGLISGTPTASGTTSFTAEVTDSAGTTATAPLAITINAPLAITTTALPTGTVGTAYSQTIGVSGGTAPYTYALSSGVLPGGLSLSSTGGQITGKPTTAGSWSFTIQVTDASRLTASQQFSLTISAGVTITSTSPLTNGTTTASYSFTFQASGGVQPYTWAVSSGALPKGITLNSATGVISGTPSAGGTASFTLQVTDAAGATASATFSLTITAGPAITSANLPSPFLGSTYSMQLQATGSNGPFTWTIGSGTLPKGLTLSSTGLLSGTPVAPGTYDFTVSVADASNNIATMSYSLVVIQVPLTLNIQVPSTTASPMQQIDVTVMLPQAYPVDLAGVLTLQFTPNPSAPVVDPAVQFVTGGGSVPFQISAGSTTALFSVSPIAVQTGSVAGTITLTATATAGGVPVTLSNNPEITVNLAQESPGILSVTIQQVTSGFNVLVTGYSNTREITQATFTFTPQSGSQLQTTSFTPSGVSGAFQSWYGSDASTPFGSQFLYTQPFTFSSGSVSTLQSVTVTLTNSQGASATASANF